MGGIGKTALALVLAHEWAPRFPDAQLGLDGFGTRTQPPPPSAAALLTQIITTFIGPDAAKALPDDEAALKPIYHDLLHGRKVLILLDNARDAAQAAPLIPPAGCALIITSRQSFMLGTTRPHDVGRLPDADAFDLLREYHPALGDADAAELARLCAGLPLALRLAGAHLGLDAADAPDGGVAETARYIARLKAGRLGTLDADAPDAGEVTITETLRLSEDLLPPVEREAWRKLGVFTVPFDARAAAAIAGADGEMLTRFLRRSLLERDGADRHRLHDLAADYARARLGEPALDDLRMAHARHFAEVGYETADLYLKGDVMGGLALFDRERAQIEAAFAWLAARPDAAAATVLLDLVDAVAYTSDLRFHPRQRIAWLEAQLAAARLTGNRMAQGSSLGNLGNAHAALGGARKAIEFYEQALVIDRQIGDRRGEASDLFNSALQLEKLGQRAEALARAEQAAEIYAAIESPHAEKARQFAAELRG